MRDFLQANRLTKVADHTVAGTDAVESASVDLAGFRGVVFLTSVGTANAGNTLKAQQSSDDGASDGWSDLAGTLVTSGSSDEDLILEVVRPTKRYVRAVVTRGASTTCESIWAIRTGASTPQLAANSVSGTQVAELHGAPAEGTA